MTSAIMNGGKVMTKSMVEIPATLYALLEPFSSEERLKIIQATLILLGEKPLATDRQPTYFKADGQEAPLDNPKEYLEQKAPKNKVEQFAVVARFRELEEGATLSMREDFEALFSALRLDFDKDKFSDDMKHGKEAGLFSFSGTMKDGFTLSAYGQKYVDLLPDRDAIKALNKPRLSKPKKSKK
jgi:hypothetical protein